MPPKYEFHLIADILPLMSKEELEVLAADIKANGLQVPIVLYQGKVLDGRNRYLACLQIGYEPTFTEYTGNDPLAHSLSLNLRRRNLTTGQKAAIAVELANMRREDTLKQNSSDARNQATVKISQTDAADMVGVSRTSVQDAVSLKKTHPWLFKEVQAGEMSLLHAMKQAHPRKYKRQSAWVASVKAARAANLERTNGSIPSEMNTEAEELPPPEVGTDVNPKDSLTSQSKIDTDGHLLDGLPESVKKESADRDECIARFKDFVRNLSKEFHRPQKDIISFVRVYMIGLSVSLCQSFWRLG
jgi:hypothetical protein